MFDFVKPDNHIPITNDDMIRFEKYFDIAIPDILKHYYLLHNGNYIQNVFVSFNDESYCVHGIIPLSDPDSLFSVEKILDDEITQTYLDDRLIPFAYDEGGSFFCWHRDDHRVYFSCDAVLDENDMELSIYMCDSVEEFFNGMLDSFKKA